MDLKATPTPFWSKLLNNKKLLLLSIIGVLILLVLIFNLVSGLFDRGIKLIAMDPSGEISIKTNLNFTFSGDVVENKDVGVTISGDLIKFNPPVPGRYRWLSRRELRFLPETPFQPSTKYTAEITPGIVKIKEKFLSGKRTVEFATYRFQVQDVNLSFNYPSGQKKGVQLQARLNFNYPVSPVELQKSLKLGFSGWGREIKYTLNTGDNATSYTLTSEPLPIDEKEKKIELSLPKGFRCIGGNLGLADNYVSNVVLGAKKPLTIVEAAPKTDENSCWIAIHCSEPVDPKAAANFIKIKPESTFKVETDGDYILLKNDQFNPGDSFNLRLAAGLPSLNGLPLEREFSATVFFADLEPSVKFNSPGRYLSSKGQLNLGLETINVEKINLEISQVYANNIVAYLNSLGDNEEEYYYRRPIEEMGRVVKSMVITVNKANNELITTPINLKRYLTDDFKGIFQVVAYDDEYRWRQDYKYVIVTDLGIVGKLGEDELVVWVNSLESLAPKAKAKVTLISKNNQTLATETTDSQGIARFKNIKKSSAGFESYIILAELDRDFAFVHLGNSKIPTTDFEVRGRKHLEEGYEAFLYLDRDIFRPGDQGNLVAVVRGPNASMPPEFPVKLEIKQPDGLIFKELQSNTRDRGACEFAISIPDYAQTGKYQVNLYVADQVIGSTAFSVEEFMPERIKVTTKLDKEEYSGGDTAAIKVEGINLFGPPAAGRRVELTLKLEPAPFTPTGYGSFTFGDPDQSFAVKDQELGESKLDAKGIASYAFSFPKGLEPPAKLKAIFQGTVIEDGGRAVSSYKVADFHAYDCYIGIKPLSEYYADLNRPFQIKYVVVDQKGKPVNKAGLTAEVFHITWNSIYRKNDEGRYQYVSEEEKNSVYKGSVAAGPDEQSFQYTPKDYGKYQIVLTDSKSQSRAATTFYACGWGYSPWTMDTPGKISLEPEHKIYKAGEQAKIQIKAPFSGKALVTVEREKIYDYQIVEFKQNTGVITIPVKEEYKPNVYVSMHLIRSIKSLEKRAPVRAFGTVPLMVDCSDRKLEIGFEVPAEVRPNRDLEVQVKVNNGSANTYLTLAAVDEGICQLTNFVAPNPSDFFYGKRSLNIESYDLYSMILPEVDASGASNSPAGDEDVRKQNLNPVSVKRVKPVALWSGLVKLDGGQAKIKFAVPQFNGTLRLMAVGISSTNFGSAQKKVIVRDPIVITPTFPRFVACRDQFAVPVSVFNGTGKPGEFHLNLKPEGPVELLGESQATLTLKNQEEQTVYFQLRAKNAVGKLVFKLQAQGNNEHCEVKEELPLRPAVPLTHELSAGVITSQKPLTLEPDQQWIPGTASYQLTLAQIPALKFAGSLQYLLGYPHGCVEQTTSKLFPLIYFNSLAQATQHEVFKGGNADYYIAQGIEKLESMQLREGNFSYWPGGTYSNDWGSVYASHFLVEARKAGYAVSDRVYNRMLGYLLTLSKFNDKTEYRSQIRVYALYVLSLAGKSQLSTMSYLKNLALDNLTDYSRAQLAAAYFYAGDRKTALELLPEAFAVSVQQRDTGGNFNSQVRSDAIILSVLADIDPTNPAVFKLVDRLSKEAEVGYWGTTQENAFALMALGKIFTKKNQENYKGEVWVDSTKIASFDSGKTFQLNDPRLSKGRITVKVSGNGECYYFMNTSGVRDQADLKEYDNGITIRREYLDRHGSSINYSEITQGDLLVAHLTITTTQPNLNNIAVVDMLPAGLEIDNPRLANSSNLSWLNEDAVVPDYLDIRDDRLILFMSAEQSGTYHFYYALRAVTCGTFILPSIKGECMYEPELSSFASSGQIVVKKE
jgi:alpha-2-macroglobulin